MCVQVHHAVGRLDWAGHANQAIFLAEHMREPPGPPFGAPSLQGLNKMTLWAVLGWEQDSDSRRTNLIPEISWSEPICSGRHRFDGHICMQRGLVFCPVVQVGVHQVVHQLLTNTFDAGACPRHALLLLPRLCPRSAFLTQGMRMRIVQGKQCGAVDTAEGAQDMHACVQSGHRGEGSHRS